MRFQVVMIFAIGLTATLHCGTAEAADLNDFIDFSGSLPGRLYVPPEAADLASPRPLVLFLHGGLAAGTDNRQHINSAMDALIDVSKQRGAFLYAPQSPTGWNNGGWRSSTEIMTMIDQAIEQENVDPDRLYVTGLSTGGGGTWDMLNHVDDRFAAAMPISTATLQSNLNAANFLGTPTWVFHSRNDDPGSIRDIINSTLSAAGEPTLTFPSTSDTTTFEYVNERLQLKYTEGATGGHYIWSDVWSTTEVMDWMFTQTLSTTPLETISLSGLDGTYQQNFDAALGIDGSEVGATFPTGWTKDDNPWVTRTTTPFPVESFAQNSTFNAGAANDSDRALAIGVRNGSDQHFLQLLGDVTGTDASSFQLQFDIEAWDARDGVFFPNLGYLGGPDDPGEAAFNVTVEIDSGDGFTSLADFGTVTTGPTLQHVFEGIVDGNDDANRFSFDSGMVAAAIPEGSSFRVRWSADTEGETTGWVFGLDNVVMSLMSEIVAGDVNQDGFVDVADLDALIAAIVVRHQRPVI